MESNQAEAPRELDGLRARLLRLAAVWLLLCLALAALGTWQRVQDNRQDVLKDGGERLQAFSDSIDTHFRAVAALSQALAQQPVLADFLLKQPVPTDESPSPATRENRRVALQSSPQVAAMSEVLARHVRDFQLQQAYVQDVQGVAVADSAHRDPVNTLGASFRAREYFIQAMETGAGFQFVMGRVSNKPGFNFSARINRADRPVGVLVLKTDPPTMQRMMNDASGRILAIVDRNGVIVAGNRRENLIRLMPDATDPAQRGVDIDGVYRQAPQRLSWQNGQISVGGQSLPVWLIGDEPHLAQSANLPDHPYRLWVLSPLNGERRILASGAIAAGLLTLGGWGLMWLYWRRADRRAALEQARNETLAMTRALPLGLFRYRLEASGRGRFVHIGAGAQRLFGELADGWRRDPAQAWSLFGCPDGLPPTEPREVQVSLGGQTRWLSVNSAAEHGQDGATTYDGYWLDVTARRRAELRFELAYQNAPLAHLFLHAQRGIERCNPATLALFRAEDSEALTGLKPWEPPLSQGDEGQQAALREHALERMRACRDGQTAVCFEWPHRRLDGCAFDASVTLMSLSSEDPDMYFAIVEDITQRKATEAALNAATRDAQDAARAKSAFLANMSHEIRTPMNAVIGMTHLALAENPPEKVRHYVNKAHHAATGLLQILNDVLDISKIESGHLELENIEFSVQDVLNEVADVLGLSAEGKGIELLFTAPPDLPSRLVGDPTRLRQVLINLGSNAVKFTDTGSVTLGLSTEPVEGGRLKLHGWVRDSGIGLSREQIDRLFQPFTQGDASTTRRHGGTGLGLAITHQLIERMGGRIWVESRLGEGATFHFTALMQAPDRSRPMAPTREGWEGRRVLVVDDHPDARDVLANMVQAMGLHADVAASGDEALARLDASPVPYDWLLVDWKMPGMDGLTLARRIQSRPRRERPCILLVTAFDRQAAIEASGDVNLGAVLTKPVTPSTLFNSLTEALGTDRFPTRALQQRAAEAVALPMPPDTSGLAGRHVLLVEDQPLNQELATELLERAGVRVSLARDGQEALDTLARLEAEGQRPDGVLMDCQMPRMDGYQATRHLREDPRWRHLPIIAMTASALVTDREQALAAGMNDHVPKPLDIDQMFRTLQRWLGPPLA
jgi:PAS domain S-box-containing protein